MKTISQVLAEGAATKTYQRRSRGAGQPAGMRETPFDERPPAKELERIYRTVPIAFNAVNKMVQVVFSKDWTIEGPNAELFTDFLENTGEVGGDMHWDEMFQNIFRYQAIYGEAHVENIMDEDQSAILDLALIDPKDMEYAEDSHGNIALDKFGNPIGYVQEIEDRFVRREDQVYDVPDDITIRQGGIFFPRQAISHFKFYTVGEGFYPIGLIEPVYRSAERFYQLQEDYANKAHSSLFPLRAAKVGDEMHEPNPDRIQEIQENLAQASSSTEIALPYYIDLEMLEAENPESMIEFFNHFSDDIISGIGIPKAFATGIGSDVNRATLVAQDKMFHLGIKDIVNRTSRTIENQIFKRKAEKEDIDGVPEFNWDLNVPQSPGEQQMDADEVEELKDLIDDDG